MLRQRRRPLPRSASGVPPRAIGLRTSIGSCSTSAFGGPPEYAGSRIPRLRGLLRRLKPWVCRRYDLMLAISEGDRRLLALECDPERLLMVPLTACIGTRRMNTPWSQMGNRGRDVSRAGCGEPALCGGYVPRPRPGTGLRGSWTTCGTRCSDSSPRLASTLWAATLQRRCERRADGSGHVFVTGFVDDLAVSYRSATVFVSPLLVAGGLLQKVVDAMAMGVPGGSRQAYADPRRRWRSGRASAHGR